MKHKHTQRKTVRWKHQRAFLVQERVDDDLPLTKTPEQMAQEEQERFAEIERNILETFKLPMEATKVAEVTELAEVAQSAEKLGSQRVIDPFSPMLKGHLPALMEKTLKLGKDARDADVKFLSTLSALASLMKNVQFFYDNHWYYPTLMLIVTGGPASGKSAARVCRFVVKGVHEEKMRETLREYEAQIKEGKTQEQLKTLIKRKGHIIPPDSTVAALMRSLADNDGCGLLETPEIDNIVNSIRSEYGNYSTILRMAFEHQPIEVARASDPRPTVVEKPRFCIVLAGTPEQVRSLLQNAENGLFSRFLYYLLPSNYDYIVNLSEDEPGYARRSEEEEFQAIGDTFYSLWLGVKDIDRIQIHFPRVLRERLQRVMQVMQDACVATKDEGIIATLHRLGPYTFRIATALTFIRNLENHTVQPHMECDFRDFDNALIIVKTLLLHCMKLYGGIVRAASATSLNLRAVGLRADQQELFDALPETFSKKEFAEANNKLELNIRTSEGWLGQWKENNIVKEIGYAKYKKVK